MMLIRQSKVLVEFSRILTRQPSSLALLAERFGLPFVKNEVFIALINFLIGCIKYCYDTKYKATMTEIAQENYHMKENQVLNQKLRDSFKMETELYLKLFSDKEIFDSASVRDEISKKRNQKKSKKQKKNLSQQCKLFPLNCVVKDIKEIVEMIASEYESIKVKNHETVIVVFYFIDLDL